MKPQALDYALLFGLAAVWGSAFVFIDVAVSHIPPATQTVYRVALASALMWVVFAFSREVVPKTPKVLLLIFLSGLFGTALPFYFIAWGQRVVEPGLTAILMAVMPLITLFLAHYFTADEKFSFWKGLGITCGLFGVVILIGPTALTSFGGDLVHQGSVLLGATCYAINAVLLKYVTDVPKITVVTLGATFGLLPLIPFALSVDGAFHFDYASASLIAIAILSAVHTVAASFVLLLLIQRQGATFFSQINLLVPLFGVFWAFMVFGEQPAINAVFGLAIILSGVIVARGNPLHFMKRETHVGK